MKITEELKRIELEEHSLKNHMSNAHNTGHTTAEYECIEALAVLSQYRNKLKMAELTAKFLRDEKVKHPAGVL
jgi:hypothetical protein